MKTKIKSHNRKTAIADETKRVKRALNQVGSLFDELEKLEEIMLEETPFVMMSPFSWGMACGFIATAHSSLEDVKNQLEGLTKSKT